MRIKYDDSDKWFSLCVRERSDWTCERCGKKFIPPAQSLHCSHLMSRRHRALRWHPDNACAHCFGCHRYLGENPIEFSEWINQRFGQERVIFLIDRAAQVLKVTETERKDIAVHYRKEHEKIIEKRAKAKTGRIEFTAWDGYKT